VNIFEKQKEYQNRVQGNWFDMSHTHKTSMQIGRLYPVLVEETLPGDKWRMQTSKMARALPMVSPMMHRVTIQEHWIYVPNRIIWKGWEEYLTVRQEDEVRLMPVMNWWDLSVIPDDYNINQSLGAYMGLPQKPILSPDLPVSALPLAAYVSIWNTYFRNTQITAELEFKLLDGLNEFPTDVNYSYNLKPLVVLWRRDYFTSALPSPTLGIDVPIMESGVVQLNPTRGATQYNKVIQADGGGNPSNAAYVRANFGGSDSQMYDANTNEKLVIDPNGQWLVNAGTIETLKSAFALQSYLEKEVKAGGLYKDSINAHWEVELPDYRVALPEFIGANYQNLVVSEVLSATQNADANLGEMAGHGISTKQSKSMSYVTYEHGWMFCLISIVPDFVLSNTGLHKKWTRLLREDYPNPSFANLGDQPIYNKELHILATSPDAVFGYIPRYSEMKFMSSRVSGMMAAELSYWHLAQEVSTTVALNDEFLYCNNNVWDTERIFAVQSAIEGQQLDHFVLDIYFDLSVFRKLPRYQLPTTLLHS